MPHESLTEPLYSIAATAQGGRAGHVTSADGVVHLKLGKPGSKTAEMVDGVREIRGYLDLAANKAVIRATCTSRPVTSAMNCMRNRLAVGPPSAWMTLRSTPD